jgi:hypothetical protein
MPAYVAGMIAAKRQAERRKKYQDNTKNEGDIENFSIHSLGQNQNYESHKQRLQD